MDTTTALRIVGLGGSLREHSSSLSALRLALESAAAAGAEVELLDVRALDLPPYLPGPPPPHPALARFAEATGGADGMIWSSPLYHGTVSGAFKNALDWLQLLADRDPPFLTGMPVGLLATAGGVQGLQAINTMEFVVRALRGWTVPFVVPVARAWQAFSHDGAPQDAAVAGQLAMLGREVVAGARRLGRTAVL
ncbi:MAG: NAD(P)H-dependent oxidoreductase [Actinomycetota bacterium]|nr:NAD(P)H-dependent oxidoreductase [Actinomycetota bacterium]